MLSFWIKRSHLGVPMIVFKSELKLVFAVKLKDPVNCLPQVKDQKVQQYALMWRIRMILMCSVHLTHAFVWVCLHVWERERKRGLQNLKKKKYLVCACVCLHVWVKGSSGFASWYSYHLLTSVYNGKRLCFVCLQPGWHYVSVRGLVTPNK